MKIRHLDLGPHPVVLAPMEDVTDIGFRLLCRKLGASMVYSEFVAADALVRMINKSMEKLTICTDERPVAIQIYGRDPGAVAEAAEIVVEKAHPDILDLNFGCPVKKVAGKGAGAGMLQTPDLMLEIIRAVTDRVAHQVPVTVKTRLGWDSEHLVITDLAEQIQDSGAEALTIHGRTRCQMYTGKADWTLIGTVKQNPRIKIPIIGNGDIDSGTAAADAFRLFGVDAVMVGRATFGRPWIFKEIHDSIDNHSCDIKETIPSSYPPMSKDWMLDVLKEQVRQSVERIDEYRGILHVRRHLAATPLFKGIPNFRQTRINMLRAETVKSLFEIMEHVRRMLHSS